MRLIPGKTKVQIELFKGIKISDIIVAAVALGMLALALNSSMSGKFAVSIIILVIGGGMLFRIDEEPTYFYVLHILQHLFYVKDYRSSAAAQTAGKKEKFGKVESVMPFTGISNGFIEYGGKYFGAVIEIPPVEFRFFSEHRRNNSIENGFGRVLRAINPELGMNLIKIERPIIYDEFLTNEYNKVNSLRASYEHGFMTEDELKSRMDVVFDRINELKDLNTDDKVVDPCYYVVLFGENTSQLNNQVYEAMEAFKSGEMSPRRLDDKELAIFLKYTNDIDFDEKEIEDVDPSEYVKWAMPDTVKVNPRTVLVNGMYTHNLRTVSYPTVVGNAWLAGAMSLPATKVVVKVRPMDSTKAVKGIDQALQELRGQYMATSIDSKLMEIQEHMDTLGTLLSMLQGDNEILLNTNIYVTGYDSYLTRAYKGEDATLDSFRMFMQSMKKNIRRTYRENSIRLNGLDFNQLPAFIGSQVSALDSFEKEGRGIPSNTVAAIYPWIYAHVSDQKGFKLGVSEGVPVFIDFFRRDSERVNSNMVIVGKSGSGKSYATKALLTNLAADDSKIFILDPENEYTELAKNLHGKFINVGNAQYGRLNPFHIIMALDDEDSDGPSGSYSTHLQFLEEFFKQVIPDCDKDALEYLNSLVDRMYLNHGITAETDLSKLRPEDYPTFDDLYDEILKEFQMSDNEYVRRMLRTLVNYVAKFAEGGRNANIWNGPSTITTDENFTVFNFQSLLANHNGSIANAQMLLVLKYIDNEIIKNRDYNTRYGCNRKVIVVIDEAHVFIDTKYPVALDFMFQMAKRIRKYNGMQIVITQNIKDFVGSEEIARKSTAIINASQYSFIFSLAPNDMEDLCQLYSKAGGINESEQEQIIGAGRGQAFTVLSPASRSSFKVVVPDDVVGMFSNPDYESGYFIGSEGEEGWQEFLGESPEIRKTNLIDRLAEKEEEEETVRRAKQVVFFEEDGSDEAGLFGNADEKAESIVTDGSDNEVSANETADVKVANDPAAIWARQSSIGEETKELSELVRTMVELNKASLAGSISNAADSARNQNNAVAAAQSMSGVTDSKLIDALDRFGERLEESNKRGFEVIMELLKDRTAAPAVVPVAAETTDEEDSSDATEGVSFRLDLTPEEASYEEPAEGVEEEETGDMDELDQMFSQLATAAAEIPDVSRIDMMGYYSENTVSITLEELASHIAIHNIH